ncbi:hypothetical protein HELRODRAFT_169440 [Helobdella robusta]|uniref:Uncharacterized protein n=1 Tax=Helobdella robusta TaxID=6412 RepID=T1F1X9_HELRO|nr:hypothetical protein HELRODRAFT_169440 [Helobdella robusta]ESO08565.1 hypothetical protein HELRODRAFT_169440 [Helobdella robusta]
MGNVNKPQAKYRNGDTSLFSNSIINNAENDRLKIITPNENRRNESGLHSKVSTEYGTIVLIDDNNNNDQTDSKNCRNIAENNNGSHIDHNQDDNVRIEVTESCDNSENNLSSISNNSNRETLITDLKQRSKHEQPSDVSTSQNTSVWAVELMFLLYKIAESILEPTVRLYLYESVCLNLYPKNNHHYICEHLKFDLGKEHEVQSNAARYMVYYKVNRGFACYFNDFYY